MIKKLLPYAKKYKIYALLCPIAIIFEVAIEVRIPFLMAVIVDEGIANMSIETVVQTGIKMILMALLSLFCGAIAARLAAVAGLGFGCEIRQAMFGKIQDFSFANTDKFSTASLVTRLTTDTNMVQMAFTQAVRICVRAPFMLVMAIFYAIRINLKLSLVFLTVTPILGVMLFTIGYMAHPRFRRLFEKYDRFNASIQENLIGIRVVKAFVRAKHEKEKFRISNDELRDASVYAEKLVIVNGPLMSVAVYACIICILWFGGNLVTAGAMQTGELISFISYVNQILMSLMMVSMIFVMTVMVKASASRIIEVLDEEPDISDANADESLTVSDGSIEYKDVCFKYNKSAEKNVLEKINLSIRSGETIGVIGGTGSAKTTLVQLIPRLYDVTEGEVTVGGADVRSYTLKTLRDSVSMVLQNNVLFSGTIEENLRWGNENATDEQLVQACKIAQADGFIRSFPDGYKTELGQGGVNVSGGQKQRLCIARAIIKAPKILILDDSTSAVDTATDAKIREGFAGLLPDTTKIIIAQRISSVEHADRIIVLDDGRINAIGTHEQLLETNEIYKEVYNSQLEGSVA
ncbi:MAG: ABC transporter ATP-binding protein [Clostridiales bacterium]|nr:ABC transporter ATP-binding protein [Clostridiales bacterium]